MDEKHTDKSRACRVMGISCSILSYKSIKNDIALVNMQKRKGSIASTRGVLEMLLRLRNEGIAVNHKRVHRVYKQLGLSLRRKVKKRLPKRT